MKMKIFMKEPKDIKPKYIRKRQKNTNKSATKKENHLFMNHVCARSAKAIPYSYFILMTTEEK